MRTTWLNDFNLSATPSEELRRRQLYHALTGNEAVVTPFNVNGSPRQEGERQRREQEFYNQARRILVSPERLERFHVEMDELEVRRVDLLARIDERIEKTREQLKRLRDEAPEISYPDGSRRKVFRDGDLVREESGALVSRDIAKAEAVSNNSQNWQEFQRSSEEYRVLQTQRIRVEQLGDRIKDARKNADEQKMSEEDMDKFKIDLEKMLADEETALNANNNPSPEAKEKTFRTGLIPARDFASASVGATPDNSQTVNNDIKQPGPAASAPVPR